MQSHVPSTAIQWIPFGAEDATHEQLEQLSADMSTDAVWLTRRDAGQQASDHPVQAGLYRIRPGRFEFESPGHETCYVISGRARVEVEGGETVVLGPGDMVAWPRGTRTSWDVTDTFVQFFTMVG